MYSAFFVFSVQLEHRLTEGQDHAMIDAGIVDIFVFPLYGLSETEKLCNAGCRCNMIL